MQVDEKVGERRFESHQYIPTKKGKGYFVSSNSSLSKTGAIRSIFYFILLFS